MKLSRQLILAALCISISAIQCVKNNNDRPPESIEGYAPVYGNPSEVNSIKTIAPQSVVSTGKIYSKGNLLYQVETGKGLHVIDITQADAPSRIAFIQIGGIEEMSIVNTMLYANNFNDLVTVDISNIQDVKEVNRIANAFHLVSTDKPPMAGWFECVDPSKGVVVGWQLKTLQYPKCRW